MRGKMANFSDARSKQTIRFLDCAALSIGEDDQHYFLYNYKCLATLCILLTITAAFGNSLILVTLHKNTSLHPPSKILLRSLAVTDLCVGVLAQPVAVTFIFTANVFEQWHLCQMITIFMYVLNSIFSGVSLLTLSAISVDRLLALLLRLRYRQVVTVKRVCASVFLFWLITSAVSIVHIWSVPLFYILWVVIVPFGLVVSTYCYTRIFLTIRRQQTQLQCTLEGQTGATGLNMERYKKTVFSALWVHITLLTCYLPFAVVVTQIAIRGLSSSIFLAQGWAFTLVYLNSSLNPVLYCWKIKGSAKFTLQEIKKSK
ncbi:adenosine receptor A3-like [Oculina patagonica]